MSAAGTPFSISVREFQANPLLFVKNRLPVPLGGALKLKFAPTPTHCGQCPSGISPPAPLIIIFGSLIGSAKATAETTTSIKIKAQNREIFIEIILFTKDFFAGNKLSPSFRGIVARLAWQATTGQGETLHFPTKIGT